MTPERFPDFPSYYEYMKGASLHPLQLSTDRFLLMKNGSGI